MFLLGRSSTIDTALEDVRRGLADAEAFMEICRFDYKRLRPKSGSPSMDPRADGGTIAGHPTPRRKSAVSASLRRPRAEIGGSDRNPLRSKVSREAPEPHEIPASAETAVAAEAPAQPRVEKLPESEDPPATAEPVAVAEEPAEPPVEKLPESEGPPAADEKKWPEMPDFLVRTG